MNKLNSLGVREGPHTSGFSTFLLSIFLLLLFITLIIVTPFPSVAADSTSATDVQKARIEAEIAAKTPLRLIIKDGLDSGLSMGWIVRTLIQAGGDPSIIVYTAVSEGRDASEAIRAALSNCCTGGMAADCLKGVVAASMGAGAGKEVVINIAMDVGCPSSQVADAIAAAETSGGPVYGLGYSSPGPTVARGIYGYGPAPAVVIGGGGGGGTRVASPSSP